MTGCTFCGIVAGQVPASRVHEDDRTLAFLDITPFSAGHTLVVPKAHQASIRDLTECDASAVWRTARLVARALGRAMPDCEGVSFLAADGEAAGQEVPHAHLHVVPRHTGDGLGFRLPPGHGPHEARTALDAVARRIAAAVE